MFDFGFDKAGRLSRLFCNGVNFAAEENDPAGLFIVQFRDFIGNPVRLSQGDFGCCEVTGGAGSWNLCFSECANLPGTEISVRAFEEADGLHWNLVITPGSGYVKTEWVDFPRVRLNRHLDGTWLLPFAEGTLITDMDEREKHTTFLCEYAEYPMSGVSNFYPGPAAMQFEAYYTANAGICILCKDRTHAPKTIDSRTDGEGAYRLLLQHFTAGADTLAYDVVFTGFLGDWQDAAELYRNWMEANDPCLPAKQAETMPQWLKDSPTFLIYAVKGCGLDWGDLTPNEYYPYVNALPVVDRYQKRWGGSIAAVLMHWEGTAPWAPPYVWPPYGGEAELKKFIDAMHERGNRVGLYASGIGWTQQSMNVASYNLEEKFKADRVTDEVCQGPRQEKWSRVCNGVRSERLGYDLCPARGFTKNIVTGEIASAAALGVDYFQYFDQNQGCAAPLCYARDHGHGELPGAWETDAMRELLHSAVKSGNGMVIGCENAAAQPYIDSCKLNDLRYHLAWGAGGVPVPVYPYLFHEYTAGFSGNGVCLSDWIDTAHSPFFVQWQLAWNFAYGNFLSVVLKDGGNIHWNWAWLWEKPQPEQEPILKLMENLTAWRRMLSENYLAAGRMLKAPAIVCGKDKVFRKKHYPVEIDRIVSAAWRGVDGKEIVILVNYSDKPESCQLPVNGTLRFRDGSTEAMSSAVLTVPAYDAVVIELQGA